MTVCHYLSIDDLFTAGLGFDLAGAVLVGSGLLLSPREIAWQAGTFAGYNSMQAVSMARNRVDAVMGFVSIGLGFLCQGAAYTAAVGGIGDETRTDWKAALGAALAALGAAVVVIALWRFRRGRAVKRLLVKVARWNTSGTNPLARPPLDLLVSYAQALQCPAIGDEGDRGTAAKRRYVARVFAIDYHYPASAAELAAGVPLSKDMEEED